MCSAGSDIYRCFVKADLMHALNLRTREMQNNVAAVSYMTFRETIHKRNALYQLRCKYKNFIQIPMHDDIAKLTNPHLNANYI